MTSDEDTKILGDTLGDSPHRYSAIESNDDISSTIGERSEKTFGAEDENGLDLESKSIPVVEKYSKTVALCFVMFGMVVILVIERIVGYCARKIHPNSAFVIFVFSDFLKQLWAKKKMNYNMPK